jgi:hypothetical protein
MPEQEQEPVETTVDETNPVSMSDDGNIKLDMDKFNSAPAVEEEIPQVTLTNVEDTIPEEVVTPEPVAEEAIEDSFIEEITEEEVVEQVENIAEEIEQAVVEQELGVPLPENIQKVVDFMNETSGTLEDYVKLNQDYSQLNETQLLREYYENTKPHLDKEDIDFMMEDNFSYDEDIDEDRDIRRKKLAHREELAKAKTHLDGMKSKYYEEIKGGSKLAPEQKKAVEFFNRYTKENEEATQLAEKQSQTFLNKTESVFNDDFKGFDYQVGDKKFRYKVKDASSVKTNQSDINNFIKKFLNKDNEMSDAKGYHKGLFTAMNSDSIAEHFYEQGKADAMKASISKSKNVQMGARGVHEGVKQEGGWQVRSVDSGGSDSKLRIKSFKNIK